MKKLIILTTSIVLFMTFLTPAILALGIKMIPGGDQPGYDINNKRAIYGIYTVSQEFISQDENLTAVGLSLGNPNLKNKKEILFTLTDVSGNEIRRVVISGANVQDGDLVKFVFVPIPESKNIKYLFSLSSSFAGPEEILTIPFSTVKTPWIGPAYYGQEIIENGLPMVVYYKPLNHLKVVTDIYSDWIRRLLSR